MLDEIDPNGHSHWWDFLFGRDYSGSLRTQYNLDFYRLLKSEFASFANEPGSDQEARDRFEEYTRQIDQVARKDPTFPTLAKLFELELLLLRAMPESAARAKVWSTRSTYHRLVGEDVYREYLASGPPDPNKGAVAAVRTDLLDLTKGKHWWYLNAIMMERGMKCFHRTLLHWLISGFLIALVLCLGIAVHGAAFAHNESHGIYARALSTIYLAAYAGILGAIISIARRVKSATDVSLCGADPVIRLSTIVNGDAGIRLSIIVGGAFALVLYFLFIAKVPDSILSPNLMPKFCTDCISETSCQDTLGTFRNLIPCQAADLGRLLIWCFIAGFAEQFVPDLLDKLAGSGKSNKKGGAS